MRRLGGGQSTAEMDNDSQCYGDAAKYKRKLRRQKVGGAAGHEYDDNFGCSSECDNSYISCDEDGEEEEAATRLPSVQVGALTSVELDTIKCDTPTNVGGHASKDNSVGGAADTTCGNANPDVQVER